MLNPKTIRDMESRKEELLRKDKELWGFEEGARFDDGTPSKQYQIQARFYPKRRWVAREVRYDFEKHENVYGEWFDLTPEFWNTLHPLRL